MLPIHLALLAYFLNAVVFLVDKYLLSSPIPRPLAYAFWVAVLSGFALFLIPFGVSLPEELYLTVAFVSGLTAFLGIVFLYESIMAGDISVASTKVGAVSAIAGYSLSLIILPEHSKDLNTVAILFLIAGIFFLAKTGIKTVLFYSIFSGICTGTSLVLLKWLFENGSFIDGVFWTRISFVAAALLILLSPEARAQIGKFVTRSSHNSQFVFFLNKVLAAGGFFILYYAISQGSVAVINALLGFQFVFVFVLALVIQPYFPKIEQKLNRKIIINKIVGITLVFVGFVLALS